MLSKTGPWSSLNEQLRDEFTRVTREKDLVMATALNRAGLIDSDEPLLPAVELVTTLFDIKVYKQLITGPFGRYHCALSADNEILVRWTENAVGFMDTGSVEYAFPA